MFTIKRDDFFAGIDQIKPISIEDEIETLIIKSYFEKEVFHNYVEAKGINELIIQKSEETQNYYFMLIGLLAYFELCLQLNNLDKSVNYEKIITEIRNLLNLDSLKDIGLLEKEIQFNIVLSSYETINGNFRKALDHINDSFSSHLKFLIDPQKKIYFEVILLNLRAYLNFCLGNYQDTILYMTRSLSLVKDLSSELQKDVNLSILNNQCLIYRTIGEYELAQDFSIQLEQNLINPPQYLNPFEISNIYNNIGMFESEQGHYEKSLELLNKSLEIHQTITNSLQEQAYIIGNIARILSESGDFIKARETFDLSLRIYDRSNSHKELVEKICWFVDLLLLEDNLILSQEYIKMAEHYAFEHESKSEMIFVEIRKAKWNFQIGNYKEAKVLFINIRSKADQNNQHRESIQCSLYLAEISLVSNDVVDLKEGLKECERVLIQSAQTSHFVYQIRSLIIKAEINGLLLEFNSALYAIDDALAIAEEKNLSYFKSKLLDLKSRLIEKRNLLTASVLDASTISKDTLIKYIRLTTGKKLHLTDELVQKLEPYYLACFVLEKTIHHIVFVEPIPKEFEMFPIIDHLTMALIFSTSLGQGNRYNEGLFVLPTPDYTSFNSIVYSKILSSSKSYLILAFNYHKELESLYYNRIEIEKYLSRMLNQALNKEFFTTDYLKELKNGFNELILREINLKVSK
jgi:tetratricopeptide (TPR) repeat protein